MTGTEWDPEPFPPIPSHWNRFLAPPEHCREETSPKPRASVSGTPAHHIGKLRSPLSTCPLPSLPDLCLAPRVSKGSIYSVRFKILGVPAPSSKIPHPRKAVRYQNQHVLNPADCFLMLDFSISDWIEESEIIL